MELSHLSKQRGFGLLEVLISMLVLGFMITILSKFQTDNRKAMSHTKQRDEAVNLANFSLDSLQRLGLSQVQIGRSDTLIYDYTTKVGKSFKVFSDVSVFDTLYNTGHVIAKKVEVNVEWDRVGTNQPTRIQVDGVIQ